MLSRRWQWHFGGGYAVCDKKFYTLKGPSAWQVTELQSQGHAGNIGQYHLGTSLLLIAAYSNSIWVILQLNVCGNTGTVLKGCVRQSQPTPILKSLLEFFETDLCFDPVTTVVVNRLFGRAQAYCDGARELETKEILRKKLHQFVFHQVQISESFEMRVRLLQDGQYEDLLNLDDYYDGLRNIFGKLSNIPVRFLHPLKSGLKPPNAEGFVGLVGSYSELNQYIYVNSEKKEFTARQIAEIRSLFADYGVVGKDLREGGNQKSFARTARYPVFHLELAVWKTKLEMTGSIVTDPVFDFVKKVFTGVFKETGLSKKIATTNSPHPSLSKRCSQGTEPTSSPKLKKMSSKAQLDKNEPSSSLQDKSPYFVHGTMTSQTTISNLSDKSFTVSGQIQNLVVLLTVGGSLFAMDQHACDERIFFESMLEQFVQRVKKKSSALAVKCSVSISFCVSDNTVSELRTNQKNFEMFGIKYQVVFDEVFVTHLPMVLMDFEDPYLVEQCILRHLADIRERKKSTTLSLNLPWESLVKDIPAGILETFNSLACQHSLKLGTKLTKQEFDILVARLARCNLPLLCAHGNANIVQLETPKMGQVVFRKDEEL